jgi:hypothetical protein
MTSRRVSIALLLGLSTCLTPQVGAQSPSALYTWDATGNAVPSVESWTRTGASATLDNSIPGTLRVVETGGSGGEITIVDGSNRVRESITLGSGGTDLTGLDWLEFDLGHNGSGIVQIQPFVQAGLLFTYVPLVPFINVAGGSINTYQVPLSGLTPAQAVYVRTMGFKAFAHGAVGDVTWIVNEVRAGGTPLIKRDLITHSIGGPDGGLQGAYVNFDGAGVLGNTGQNQTGLSHNPSGPGSLQWTDVGGGPGGAIEWGNGTAWDPDGPGGNNGNTFNNREADLSNYDYVLIRLKATDPLGGGGTVGFTHYYRRNDFSNQTPASVGPGINLPIDGRYHTIKLSLAGMTLMEGVDALGINVFSHPQDLIMNVDRITFFDAIPEPATSWLVLVAMIGYVSTTRCGRQRA